MLSTLCLSVLLLFRRRNRITATADMHACTTLHELVDKIHIKVEIAQENKPPARQQA